MKPRLETASILFVEPSETLLQDYLNMVNDLEHVGRFIGKRTEPISEEQELAWLREKLTERAVLFSMLEKGSGEFIGNIELMDMTDSSAELGIALTAKKQGRGYGTEAIPAMVAYGSTRLGLKRIFLKACPYNLRAIHVYEKCGFREYERTDEDVFMEILTL